MNYVDCGECPRISTGCEEGHCMKKFSASDVNERAAKGVMDGQGKAKVARPMNRFQARIVGEIAAAEALDWQGMETAPKDGTPFLAKTDTGRLTIAEWSYLIDAFLSQLDVYGNNSEIVAWSPIGGR